MMEEKISKDCRINQHFSCDGFVTESSGGETLHYACACRCHSAKRTLVAA